MRELVKTKAIDVVVCYSLGQITLDPRHVVIITQKLEKHRVILEAMTKDIDKLYSWLCQQVRG